MARRFDGVDDYVRWEDGDVGWMVGATQLTAAVWIYPFTLQALDELFCKADFGALEVTFSMQYENAANGHLIWAFAGSIYQLSSTLPLVVGRWHRVLGWFDGTQGVASDRARIWVDGRLPSQIMTGTVPTALSSTTHPLTLARAGNNARHNHCAMADLCLWDTALTPGEIASDAIGDLVRTPRFRAPLNGNGGLLGEVDEMRGVAGTVLGAHLYEDPPLLRGDLSFLPPLYHFPAAGSAFPFHYYQQMSR